MAAERKPAGSAREKRLEKAFRRFVELVRPIEDVRHVVAFDEGEADVFTYITRRDEGVLHEVFQQEYTIMDEFPDVPLDFHVRYLEGRALEEFTHPLPLLAYSRDVSN